MVLEYFHNCSIVILIFNRKGKNVLKKYKQDDFGLSHLYRLIGKPEVKEEIDQNEIYFGSMTDDWEILKPKVIPDPDDMMPWVDTSMMDDPEDKKPEDWVTASVGYGTKGLHWL